MKKSIFIVLFSAWIFCGRSQSYIPMLDSYAEWHITGCYFGCVTDKYYTMGDTTIGGLKYKFLDLYHYMRNFLIREDTLARQIFIRFIGPSIKPPADQLVYDFSMQVNDTIDVVNPNSPAPAISGKFVLDSIIPRMLVLKPHRYFYLHALDTITAGVKNTIWVEGIGSLCLINTPGEPPNISGIGQLSCFFNNGIQQYEDLDSISTCQSIYPISVKEIGKFKNSISICPNPAKDLIVLKSENYSFENLKIEIINILSEIELTADYHNAINISVLRRGIYFLRFEAEGQTCVLKFIKD